MKLTLATYGFFVLPMRGERCVGLVAPANAVDDAVHLVELMIDGVVDASTLPGVTASPKRQMTIIPLAGCRLGFGTPEPAAASNFDLILNVSDLFCDGVLKAAYATHPSADVVVEFSAGSVAAAADRYTASQEWSIGGCGALPGPRRRLTSLVVYSCDTWAGRVDCVRRDAPGALHSLQFAKDATLALRNVTVAANHGFSAVNNHHAESTKPLLSRYRDINDAFSKHDRNASNVPQAELSSHVASFLGLDPLGATWRRAPENGELGEIEFWPPPPVPFEGDPHCSMRKAQVPTKKRGEHLGDLVPPVIPRRA